MEHQHLEKRTYINSNYCLFLLSIVIVSFLGGCFNCDRIIVHLWFANLNHTYGPMDKNPQKLVGDCQGWNVGNPLWHLHRYWPYEWYCWWRFNPANQLIGILSHYLQGFSTIPGGCLGLLPSGEGMDLSYQQSDQPWLMTHPLVFIIFYHMSMDSIKPCLFGILLERYHSPDRI